MENNTHSVPPAPSICLAVDAAAWIDSLLAADPVQRPAVMRTMCTMVAERVAAEVYRHGIAAGIEMFRQQLPTITERAYAAGIGAGREQGSQVLNIAPAALEGLAKLVAGSVPAAPAPVVNVAPAEVSVNVAPTPVTVENRVEVPQRTIVAKPGKLPGEIVMTPVEPC
jgi:hypothetical protein